MKGRTLSTPPQNRRMSAETVFVLVVLVLTAFIMMVNETTLAVALPFIMADFSITAATAQWLLTGVMLTMSIVLPTTGWMLDRFTTRQVYGVSITSFLLGTIVAALSPSFAVMLGGRVLQAIGTAIILPLIMTVVMTVVPPHRRGTVMGVISVVMAVGPALGPTIAGLILTIGHWHLIFWLLVPFVALAGLIGAWKLGNVGEIRDTPLDAASVVLSAFAFGGLVYALSSIGLIVAGGPRGTIALVAAGVGLVALATFVLRQLRLAKKERALLDLRPLTVWNFTVALIGLLAVQAALLGLVATLPLYLQGALLTSALVAGLVTLPGGAVETVLSPAGGWLFDRIGPKPLAIPGTAALTVSLFLLAGVDHTTPVWRIIVYFVILSIGLSFIFTPLMTTALGSLPKELYSHGSAILNTLVQLAAALGTAVTVAVFSYVSVTGGETREAIADGASSAYLVASGISVVAVVASVLLRKVPREKATVEMVTDVDPVHGS